MTIFLLSVAIVFAIVGIVGAIVPAIPGPPLNFLSMLLVYFAFPGKIGLAVLIVMCILMVFVTVLDYVAPSILVKIGGGSKYANRGAMLGTIIGLFFLPWGLILGPFVGAFIGHYLSEYDFDKSLKVASLSFLAFLLSTGMKLIASLLISYYTFSAFL